MPGIWWTDERIQVAAQELTNHSTLDSAAAALSGILEHHVSAGGLQRAMTRAGIRPIELLKGRGRAPASPVEARKAAASYLNPPPVVEAARRGRGTVESIRRNLKMEREDVEAELSAAAADGYAVRRSGELVTIEPTGQAMAHYEPWDEGEPLTIGCISDTHAGHRGFNSEALTEFCHTAVEAGAVAIVHTGDITDGNYHKGQAFELKRLRSYEQTLELLAALPYFKDVPYFFINGNHDESYFRGGQMEVATLLQLQAQAEGRSDIHPLGTTLARIQWGKGPLAIRVMLSHAKGKNAVSKEQGPSRPDVYIQGHFHDAVSKTYGGITYIRPGGFQTTSRFYDTLGGAPDIAGTILTVCKHAPGRMSIEPVVEIYPHSVPVWHD
jgi:predicted phosphodiesterase